MSGVSAAALIPTHHRWDLLGRALDSLGGLPALVVDDSPQGSLPPVLAQRCQERVRTRGEEGFARAVNLGLARAEALGIDWVLLLNDDAWLEPGAVDALLAARKPGVGVVGPVLVDGEGQESAGVVLRSWGRVSLRRTVETGAEVQAISGACMLLRSSERLDGRFRHGMEDFELCRRVRERGLSIRVVTEARCHHPGGGSIHHQSRAAQRHGLSGQLRLMGGGWRSPLIVGMALAQVIRERGPTDRILGIWEGWQDWRQAEEAQPPEAASTRL